jgi:3-hydroxyisobutyrate dehydrogenase
MISQKMKVGFIGLGNMGWHMAANVLKAGYDLSVFDLDVSRVRRFAQEVGGTPATAVLDLKDRDVVVTMLPFGKAVRDALSGGEGGGLVAALPKGAIVIDMSSAEPEGTREFAGRLAELGISMLDAPVSGGVPAAQAGKLVIMIGSDDSTAIEKTKVLLGHMGDTHFLVGRSGCGHALKALNNYVGATVFAATSEAMLVGERFGLDRTKMIEVMDVSTGRNFYTDLVMRQYVISGKFSSGFALSLMVKDVNIAAGLGRSVHRESPLLELVSERYAAALEQRGATSDFTELYQAWESLGPQREKAEHEPVR